MNLKSKWDSCKDARESSNERLRWFNHIYTRSISAQLHMDKKYCWLLVFSSSSNYINVLHW